MKIHRSVDARGGAAYPVEMLQDVRLSWAARGLLVDLLSRPGGWHGNVLQLSQEARQARGYVYGEGRAGVGSLFAELERFGYLSRKRTRDAQGGFTTVLDVFDTPQHGDLGEQPKPDTTPKFPRGEYLYRHWDANETLLYVGLAKNPTQREQQHVKSSPWMVFHAATTRERFETRGEAERAEATAIAKERPLFNVAGNDTPEARQRLLEYLEARGRTDLLASAVSRG